MRHLGTFRHRRQLLVDIVDYERKEMCLMEPLLLS